MKHIFLAFITLLGFGGFAQTNPSFYTKQLQFPRVREAVKLKGKAVEDLLKSKGINTQKYDMYIRAFKKERVLEVWVKNQESAQYTLAKTYDFCATTGVLGPKRRSGDRQMPEGFYTVNAFNPQSEYILSFRVGYPNASDLKFADPVNPGDNIFIHGSCLTIGCIPVGDELINELYLFAIKAKNSGNDIPVHIFPTKLSDDNYNALKQEFSANNDLIEFWSWLKPGYQYFENTHKLPKVTIAPDGKYVVN